MRSVLHFRLASFGQTTLYGAVLVSVLYCAFWVGECPAQIRLDGDLTQPPAAPESEDTADGLPQSMQDAGRKVDVLAAQAEERGDLRTQAMLAWRNPIASFPEGTARLASLAAAALSSEDPSVLLLLSTGCDAPEVGCDALPLAQRWTQIDTDNAAAWLELWHVSSRLGDNLGAEEALSRAAAAPFWRDYSVEFTQAFVDIVPPDQEVLVRLTVRLQSAARVVGIVNSLYREMLGLCRLPSQSSTCTAITTTLSKAPVSLLQATVSASLSQHFGAGEVLSRQRRERVEAYQWAVAQGQPHGLLSSNPRANASEVIAYIDSLNSHGEVSAAQQWLQRDHLTESEAAMRYRANRDANRAPQSAPPASGADRSGAGLRLPTQ